MPEADGRRPEVRRLRARLREAPDDEDEADDGQKGIDALPRAFAEPCDRRVAPALRDDARRMQAEEEDEAENEKDHRMRPKEPYLRRTIL